MKDKLMLYVKENREATYFWCGFLGLVLLFLTLGIFLLLGAKRNFVEADALKNRLSGLRKFQQQHSDIAAYRGEMESKYNRLDEQLPQNIDVNNLLLHVNALAATGNIKINDLVILPEEVTSRKAAYRINRLRIICVGQCQQLLDFMKAVEQQDNLMLFSDVVLEAKENNIVFLSGVINYYTR